MATTPVIQKLAFFTLNIQWPTQSVTTRTWGSQDSQQVDDDGFAINDVELAKAVSVEDEKA